MYSRALKNLGHRAKAFLMDKTSRHITIDKKMMGGDAETFAGMKPSDIGLQNMPMKKMKK